jgi:CTP synthase
MRLGSWKCDLLEDSKVAAVYNETSIMERHRHRYEFNNDFKQQIENSGMKATGFNPDTGLVEIVEIPNHPWFIGVQYHPEYKSTVANPHPLFLSFVRAALNYKTKK